MAQRKSQRRGVGDNLPFRSDELTKLLGDDSWKHRAELVVEKKSGKVRQAGASRAQGKFVEMFKRTCELNLFAFLDGVMNFWFLHPVFHKNVCDWLTAFPPNRKMLLMPRNHGKTTILRGLPIHAMIQPALSNIYYPGMPGTDLRLVFSGETEEMAVRNLRVIKGALENNVLLRALWPHVVWENPRKQSKKWSDDAIIIPRGTEFAEPTVRAIGVGGAVTGMHPIMLIKDDLTTQKAANEPPTMAKAIEWHTDSRALFANPEKDLEFITGTRWAAFDLPSYIMDNDPTVEVNTDWRRVVDSEGTVLWPNGPYDFKGSIEQLQKEHGVKFPLLYMNEVSGTDLTDFLLSDLRDYEFRGDNIVFNQTEQDLELSNVMNAPAKADPDPPRGMDFYTALTMQNMTYLRNTRSL